MVDREVLAAWANDIGRQAAALPRAGWFRRAPHLTLASTTNDLLRWHAWADPNGEWANMARDPDAEVPTLNELWDQIEEYYLLEQSRRGLAGADDSDDGNDPDSDAPTQEDLEDAAVITDTRRGGYRLVIGGREVNDFDQTSYGSFGEAVTAAQRWMKQHNYWPGLFYINERGNIDLLDQNGEILQSWV